MKPPPQSVSPRLVAEALGVSESSVKRWSDQGLMATRKTAGGHRKLVVADVLRFVREHGYDIGKPELLGLPGRAPHRPLAVGEARAQLLAALLGGDRDTVRRIVVGLFVEGLPLVDVFDEALAPALRELGRGWEHGGVRVFEEHRAIGLVETALHDLRALLPRRKRPRHAAFVAAPSGDPYTIAIGMSELVLVELGFRATNLGADTPAETLVEAVVENGPRVLALGVHHLAVAERFIAAHAPVAAAARAHGTTLVLGGAGASPEIRAALGAAGCGSMRELAALCGRLPA